MMNSSFLYHAWGLYDHKCSGIEYKGNTIILHIETKTPKKTCPQCGSMHFVKNGYRIRDFIGLPIGGKKVIFRMKAMTLKDASNLLGVTWDTIKDIHTRYLERHYAPPSLDGVDCIGIDEFAVRKGNVYKTIVVDLRSGCILYVGEGKGADALEGFWKRVKRYNPQNEMFAGLKRSVLFLSFILMAFGHCLM